jgi:hypothetical protein
VVQEGSLEAKQFTGAVYILILKRDLFPAKIISRQKPADKWRGEQVQRQVRSWRVEGGGRKMCSARPSWMSISQQTLGYKDTLYKVAVDLPDVLEIDTKNMVVRVEPSVTIGIYKFTFEDQVCFILIFYLYLVEINSFIAS